MKLYSGEPWYDGGDPDEDAGDALGLVIGLAIVVACIGLVIWAIVS